MKGIIALLMTLGIAGTAFAGSVGPTEMEPELGNALGFHIYHFEVNLGTDEVLVVRAVEKSAQGTRETEYAAVGSDAKASYQIVLVESGAFQPSLQNTYILRYPDANIAIKDKRLSQWGNALKPLDGINGLQFSFTDPTTNQVVLTYAWSASHEKYSEVAKRWPNLPPPIRKGFRSVQRVVSGGN